jgi:hypothetical protein
MLCAWVILYYILWPVWPIIFLSTSHKWQEFRKKVIENKMGFWFSLQFFQIYLILRRSARDIIINMHRLYIGIHVKYTLFLSDFNKIWTFSTDFRKILKYDISWKSVQWEPSCSMRTDGRTDMTKIIVAYRNVAKAPKYHRHWPDFKWPT